MGTRTQQNEQTAPGLEGVPLVVPGKIILQAVMGSHAYGLARPDSDIDRKGVYAASTLEIAGLHPPKETVTHTDPDFEYHEVGKFCRLALKCNPTVLEQLYVDDHEILTGSGWLLVRFRSEFLSRKKVFDSFGGYAMSQIQRLNRRGDGSFSSDTRLRREKHARHCFRLLAQGEELLRTGSMNIKVARPDILFKVGELPDDALTAAFESANEAFQEAYEGSVLPDEPNEKIVSDVLNEIRYSHP